TELRDYLRAFDEPNLSIDDYEEAARIHNQCRSRGIAGSAIDFLICAAAIRRDWQIFTTDQDFPHYAKACPLQLYNLT
ncbi:MAG: PIN domain-containing protein, partial [Candidatus Sulfotelmatobacter sp.]